LKEENVKITLPKDLQKEMMDFFLKTSIPRKKKMLLSENKPDGSEEK